MFGTRKVGHRDRMVLDMYSRRLHLFFFIACSGLQEKRECEVPIEGYAD